MSSLLFQSTSLTLLFLSFLSFSTSIPIFDTNGQPVENGKTYYISTLEGDLTFTIGLPPCPLRITPQKILGFPPGTPVKISSPLKTFYISSEDRVTLAFESLLTPCPGQSLVWTQTFDPWARRAYITTGGDEGARSFSITNSISSFGAYELKYWPSSDEDAISSNVGLYENDKLLGITEVSSVVRFKKAFDDDVLELSSTS